MMDDQRPINRPNTRNSDHVSLKHNTMATAIREDVDVDRHAGESAPTEPIPRPQLGASFKVDDAVIGGPSPSNLRVVINSIYLMYFL